MKRRKFQKEADHRISECLKIGERATDLDLSGLELHKVPEEVAQIRWLKTLRLYNNHLQLFPKEILKLRELRGLNLSNNPIRELPAELSGLKRLTELALSQCALTSLPDQIAQLTELRELNIHSNLITSLPEAFGNLRSLVALNLGGNNIKSPPPTLASLSKLSRLWIWNNQLKHIPSFVWKLRNLTYLNLQRNAISVLPKELKKLHKLTELWLQFNHLTQIPDEIGELSHLEVLRLNNNRLTLLPKGLSKLPSLAILVLNGNQKLGIPDEILGPKEQYYKPLPKGSAGSPGAILEYYFNFERARRRGRTVPLNEAKLLVLGQPEAGKSSLIHALTIGYPSPDFAKTDGIARRAWDVNVVSKKNATGQEKGIERLRLNLWDFGGQEIYKSTHTFFLTRRAIYVIVTTARKDTSIDQDLEEWLETARTFGANSPVWVVINKHDENPLGGPDETALMRKYHPMLRGFIRTQCQHAKSGVNVGTGAGLGIDTLREKLVEEALAMPEVRQRMSQQAMAIKRALETMSEPTLTMDSYRAICRKLGESGPLLQETLLDLWDKLGTVRYFPDGDAEASPAMRDTAIINPEWVTEAVYQVLEDPKLKAANGLITEEDLDRILKAMKRPMGSYTLIANVMRRFSQLFDAGDGRMFIPQLLDEREPVFEWPEDSLNFIYRYPVLPPGLMPVFIARTHLFHATSPKPWRRGCVLDIQGCRVRVIGDKKLRQVEISVVGSRAAQRRDALDQVRFKFEELHRVVTGMETLKELIPVPRYPSAPMLDYRFLRTLESKGVEQALFPADAEASEALTVLVADALGGVRGTAMRSREKVLREKGGEGGILHLEANINIQNENRPIMSAQNISVGGDASGNAFGVGSAVLNKESFNKIEGVHGHELMQLFETLKSQLRPLQEEMRGKDYKILTGHVSELVAEAQKPQPDKGALETSGQGIVEAAKTIKDIAGPVIATAGMIMKFFGIPVP